SNFPVCSLYGFSKAWKLQVRVSVPCRVECVLKPRPPGNSVSIQPVCFHLHNLLVQPPRNAPINFLGSQFLLDCAIQCLASAFKLSDSRAERFEVESLLQVRLILKLIDKLPDVVGVKSKIERKNVSVRQS